MNELSPARALVPVCWGLGGPPLFWVRSWRPKPALSNQKPILLPSLYLSHLANHRWDAEKQALTDEPAGREQVILEN
jgi:hypothetical protein